MAHPTAAWDQVRPYFLAFQTHYRLWVIPTIVSTMVALVYSVVMPRAWRASQAIFVRDEVIGKTHSPGQFESIDRMQVFQETILEVARNRMVVAAVLRKLGSPPNHSPSATWPTEQAIESLQNVIVIDAPKGSQFGRNQIFSLSIAGKTPQEAILRTKALCDELEKHLGELRDANARSMVRELDKALQLAQKDLDDATGQLESMERAIGPDLGELRVMNEVGSGDSNLRTGLNQIKTELRQSVNARESLIQLRDLLIAAGGDTNQLLATPTRLLDAQPGLRRLKEGLVDAQLRCAILRGKLNESHPSLISAVRTEVEIRNNLNAEVATAVRGVEADLKSNEAQIGQLQQQQDDLQQRLDQLAGLRARYSNQVADVKQRTEIVDNVRRDLSNAQASSNAASSISLLTRFQEPVAGDRPVGPGRKAIVAGGMGGGFALGAGLVFLFMPIGPNGTRRRWNDYMNFGRRTTDRILGRRVQDRASVASAGSAVGSAQDAATSGRRAADVLPQMMPSAMTGRREKDAPAVFDTTPGTAAQVAGERRPAAGRRTSDRYPAEVRVES